MDSKRIKEIEKYATESRENDWDTNQGLDALAEALAEIHRLDAVETELLSVIRRLRAGEED